MNEKDRDQKVEIIDRLVDFHENESVATYKLQVETKQAIDKVSQVISGISPVINIPEQKNEVIVKFPDGIELIKGKDANPDDVANILKSDDGFLSKLKAKDADEGKIIESVISKIKLPKDGEPGKDADESKIIKSVLSKIKIPKPEKGKDAVFDMDLVLAKVVEKIPKQVEVDISAAYLEKEINTLDKKIDWKVLKNIPYDVLNKKSSSDNAIHRGGMSRFTQLIDAPSSYSGQGGKIVAVKSDLSGLEFIDNPESSDVDSVSNSDGTLTISPTTGAVVASLNLANPNTWTATQTFSDALTGNLTYVTSGSSAIEAIRGATGYAAGDFRSSSNHAGAYLSSSAGYGVDAYKNPTGVAAGYFIDGTNTTTLANGSYALDAVGSGHFQLSGIGDVYFGSGFDAIYASVSNGTGVQAYNSSSNAGVKIADNTYAIDATGTSRFTGNVELSNATASTLASFDGSKNLVSLATSTYPSLTELAFVKGVTSAIQTQLNGKVTGATNATLTLTGTTLGLNLGNANTWTANQSFDTFTLQSLSTSRWILNYVSPPIQTITTSTATTGGTLAAATYYIRVSYVTSDGTETEYCLTSVTQVTTGSTSTVTLNNIPVSANSRVTKRKIYFSSNSATITPHTTINDNTTTTLTITAASALNNNPWRNNVTASGAAAGFGNNTGGYIYNDAGAKIMSISKDGVLRFDNSNSGIIIPKSVNNNWYYNRFAIFNTVDEENVVEFATMYYDVSNILWIGHKTRSGSAREVRIQSEAVGTTLYMSLFRGQTQPAGWFDFSEAGTSTPTTTFFRVNHTSNATSAGYLFRHDSFTANQSGTAGYTVSEMTVTETATGSGAKYLANWKVGGVQRFYVDNTGGGYFLGRLGVGEATPQSPVHLRASTNPSVTITSGAYASGKDAMFFGVVTSANSFVNGTVAGDSAVVAKSGGILYFGTAATTGTAQGNSFSITGTGAYSQPINDVAFSRAGYDYYYRNIATTRQAFNSNGNTYYTTIASGGDGTNGTWNVGRTSSHPIAGPVTPTNILTVSDNLRVGINVAAPTATFDVLSTTEQMRLKYDASNYYSTTVGSTGGVTFNAVGSGSAFTFADKVIVQAPVQLQGYTVATLPAGTQGMTAFVTDALAPTYLTAIVGGGAIVTPVFYNGTAWVAN